LPAATRRTGLAIRLPNWLGDVCLATRALDALVARFSAEGPVTLIARPWAERLWRARWPEARWSEAPGARGGWPARVPALAQVGAKTIVLFPPSLSSRLHAFFAGVPQRIGLAGEAGDFLLTGSAPRGPRGTLHLEDEYLDLARVVGAEPVARAPLVLPAGAAAEAGRKLAALDAELAASGDAPGDPTDPSAAALVVAPGARYGPTKRWPPERFAEAARLWALAQPDPARVRVWIVGGDEDRLAAAAMLAASAPAPHVTRDLSGRTDLVMLARLLSRARAVLANDSGVAHLAAALDRPVVVVFGSTDPRWTAPRSPLARAVTEPVPCAPCFRRACAIPDRERCLRGVAAERVAETLVALSLGRSEARA
jgi:heptosyltransferase-2